MKSIIHYSLFVLLFIVVIVGYDFQLYPFKFQLNSYTQAIGWLLIFIGIIMVAVSIQDGEYIRGYNDAFKDLLEKTQKK